MADENQPIQQRKSILKKWWFWLVVGTIAAAALFIPFDCPRIVCIHCIEGEYCPPCPQICESVIQKIF
ncbi:hypothetical protein ACFL0L_05095 [Patescibacteria group bacterium]